MSMLSALERTSVQSEDLSARTQCALCGAEVALRSFQKHVGSHQQQLALFAFPATIEDDEEESEDAGSGSMR